MNYAQELQTKLDGRKKISILEVGKYLDDLSDLSDKSVNQFKDIDKSGELEVKENEIEELEEEIEELKSEIEPNNLLTYQIKKSFDEIINSPFINQLKFLNLLEQIEKQEIKL